MRLRRSLKGSWGRWKEHEDRGGERGGGGPGAGGRGKAARCARVILKSQQNRERSEPPSPGPRPLAPGPLFPRVLTVSSNLRIQKISAHPGPVPGTGAQRQQTVAK